MFGRSCGWTPRRSPRRPRSRDWRGLPRKQRGRIPSGSPFRCLDTAPRQFVHCPQKYFAGGVSSKRLERKASITSMRSKLCRSIRSDACADHHRTRGSPIIECLKHRPEGGSGFGEPVVADAPGAWRHFDQTVLAKSVGKFLISELTLERVKTWRNGLVTKPRHRRCGRFSKKATIAVDLTDKRTRDRRKDTANRILGTLKAALNFACQEDFSIMKVWTAVKPFENVGQPRVNYLEIPDQRRLLAAATGAIHDLIEAALLTGCRFGELSRLRVDDFDFTNGSLFVWESKSKKTRHIWLSEAGIELFKRVANPVGKISHRQVKSRIFSIARSLSGNFSRLKSA
jgi:Phage integrase family